MHATRVQIPDTALTSLVQNYQDIVEPALEQSFDSRTILQPDKIQDEIRPPYSYIEVKNALDYGADHSEGLQLLESDMDLYLLEK